MEFSITTTNSYKKTKKNNNYSDQNMTTIGLKKEMSKENSEQQKGEVSNKITGGDALFKTPGNEEAQLLIKDKKVKELESVFRPKRTLSRSPIRISGEAATTDIDLTGDEEENVFTDTSEQHKEEIKDEWDKLLKGKNMDIQYDPELGAIGLSLTAIARILGMLEASNEIVSSYLCRVKNANATARNTSIKIGEELAKAKELAVAAAETYRKEKIDNRENEKMNMLVQRQAMDKWGGRQENYLDTKNDKLGNINKRKNITPPQEVNTVKKTKRMTSEYRSLPKVRSVQIIKQANEGVSSDSDWEVVKTRRNKSERRERKDSINENTVSRSRERNYGKNALTPIRKGEAVTIKVEGGKSFAEVTKNLKQKMGKAVDGIKRIRQTRTGDLLVEFNAKADSASFHEKAQAVLGKETKIKRLIPRVKVEILDIDPAAEIQEILEALVQETGLKMDDLVCRSLRRGYMGTQIAIIDGPTELLSKIKEDKVRIGWVRCRVRKLPEVIRCFKCHNLGHVASRCALVQGDTKICRRCGIEGHIMSECSAENSQCRLCVDQGLTGNAVRHVAGSVRCAVYKKVVNGGRTINQNSY